MEMVIEITKSCALEIAKGKALPKEGERIDIVGQDGVTRLIVCHDPNGEKYYLVVP